jgi:hypothetical protein
VQSGTSYRLVGWISNAAFRTWLPWNAPSTDEIVGAVRSAWPSATVILPWQELPADWPKETVPSDAFLVRAEGPWTSSSPIAPAALPIARTEERLHVAQLWAHSAEQQPIAPEPPQPSAEPPAPAPRPLRPPRSTPVHADAESTSRGLSTGAKVALGGGALVGLAFLLARARARNPLRQRIPA